jgi:hypothetical protein
VSVVKDATGAKAAPTDPIRMDKQVIPRAARPLVDLLLVDLLQAGLLLADLVQAGLRPADNDAQFRHLRVQEL